MLDVRKAMGELTETARQWCRAFDAGDLQAVEGLGLMMAECLKRMGESSAKAAAGKT
jgi:hypothetical protein